MDLDTVADELFGLAPGDFIGVRDTRAKQARADGDRELAAQIAALRKPTVVAWLANQLARERPEQVGPFLELGESLREATASLRGPALRELSQQRQRLVHALVQQARGVAGPTGPRITEDVLRGLEETLHAALADPAGAELLAAGRLSSGLQHSGFGGPTSAAAPPQAPRQTPPAAKARRRAADDEHRAAERRAIEEDLSQACNDARLAADARDAAAAAADDTAASHQDAARAYDDAAARVAALEEELRALRQALDDATAARDRTAAAHEAAEKARSAAADAADEARRVVTDLQDRLDAL
ncbi:MAG: hypothetical protein ACXV3C_10970 [Actinomycetes bacterium]